MTERDAGKSTDGAFWRRSATLHNLLSYLGLTSSPAMVSGRVTTPSWHISHVFGMFYTVSMPKYLFYGMNWPICMALNGTKWHVLTEIGQLPRCVQGHR